MVLVEDVAAYQGRVVVVIGVLAVIRVPSEDGAGDSYRAAELRCCRPGVDVTSMDAAYGPVRARPDRPSGVAR
jgi:hypothetical protein